MVRKTMKRTRGAGYLSPAEFFNPSAVQPESNGTTISSEPVPGWVRPPLVATSVVAPSGGSRRNRKTSRRNRKTSRRNNSRRNRKVGGFAPAVMGSFVANAESAIVPLALYGLYSMLGWRKTFKAGTTKNAKNAKNSK